MSEQPTADSANQVSRLREVRGWCGMVGEEGSAEIGALCGLFLAPHSPFPEGNPLQEQKEDRSPGSLCAGTREVSL